MRALAIAIAVAACGGNGSGGASDAASDGTRDGARDAPGTPAITANPTSCDLAGVCLGDSNTCVVAFTNAGTGPGALAFGLSGTHAGQFAIEGTTCAPPLAPGATCSTTARFAPTSPGTKSASLTATSSTGAAITVSLLGTGLGCSLLSASASGLSFAPTASGSTTAVQSIVVTNLAHSVTTGALTLSTYGANPAAFEIATDTCTGVALGPSASCQLAVRFHPTTTGPLSASLRVTGSPGGQPTITLSGEGTSALAAAPQVCDVGAMCMGDSDTCNATFTNVGATAESISLAVSGSDASAFAIEGSTCSTPLAPASSCTATVRFTALGSGGVGAKTAVLTATSGSGSSAGVPYLGTALSCVPLRVTPFGGLAFGTVAVGATSAVQSLVVSNTAHSLATGPLSINISGAQLAAFEIVGDQCSGVSLAPSTACTIDVRFHPTVQGQQFAQVDVSASPGGAVTTGMSGLGGP